MTSTLAHDLAWFQARLDPDDREGYFRCPVCGAGNLHVEQKNGKPLVNGFSCEDGYVEVVAALEGQDEDEAPPIKTAPVPRVTRGRRSRKASTYSTSPVTTGSATTKPRSTDEPGERPV